MARYLGPKCRQCRREGEKLFLKGERCFTDKCAIEKRNYPPGQHGQKRVGQRATGYGLQLREKQKLRRLYGVLENQFRDYYAEADRLKGVTGESLLQLLECRLDNVVYRMGMAGSRMEARQVVRHNSVLVNGDRVNIPSYQVKPNDVVQISESAKKQSRITSSIKIADERGFSDWIEVDVKALKGVLKSRPQRDELPSTINESLVIEFYSK